jgi:hypothetical protein
MLNPLFVWLGLVVVLGGGLFLTARGIMASDHFEAVAAITALLVFPLLVLQRWTAIRVRNRRSTELGNTPNQMNKASIERLASGFRICLVLMPLFYVIEYLKMRNDSLPFRFGVTIGYMSIGVCLYFYYRMLKRAVASREEHERQD